MRLERVNPDRNEYRFYEVTIEPTLFRDHALLIRWGRIGKPSRQRIAETGALSSIRCAAEKIVRQKRRTGYEEPDVTSRNPHQSL